MEEATYNQPFLQLTPFDTYPKIHDIVNILFPEVNDGIHNNFYTLLSGLLVQPKLAVSRSNKHYKSYKGPPWYTRYKAVIAQNLLIERGLIKLKRGYRTRPRFEKGFCSVITATDTLENLLKGIILKPVKVDSENQSVLTLDRIPLNIKEINKLHNFNFDHSPLSKEILSYNFENILMLNKNYFSGMTLGFEPGSIIPLDGMCFEEAREVTRKNGNNVAFGMAINAFFTSMFTSKGCGRLYQRCQSFQNIQRGLRKLLTINGSKTTEADYSSMHINLLYFICGKKNPYFQDSYEPILKEFNFSNNPNLRDIVKRCVLVDLNTSDFVSYSKSIYWNYPGYVKKLAKHNITLKSIHDAFAKIHATIKPLLNSNIPKPDLIMFIESKIIKAVLNKLHKKNINGLPLHDGIIYDNKYKGTVEKIMEEEYKLITGGDILIKSL